MGMKEFCSSLFLATRRFVLTKERQPEINLRDSRNLGSASAAKSKQNN